MGGGGHTDCCLVRAWKVSVFLMQITKQSTAAAPFPSRHNLCESMNLQNLEHLQTTLPYSIPSRRSDEFWLNPECRHHPPTTPKDYMYLQSLVKKGQLQKVHKIRLS